MGDSPFNNETLIRELTKLSVKMDMVCNELEELKNFNKSALQRITVLEERVRTIEEWKEEMTRYQRLKTRFTYDLRSAVAGGLAGGGIGSLFGFLLKLWG